MDNTPQPIVQPQNDQPVISSSPSQPPQSHKSKSKSVLITLTIIVLCLGLGALGYMYKTTNDSLKTQSQKLEQSYKTIEDFQKIINTYEEERDFVAKHNDADLSRNLCNGTSLAMSDVHVNDKFITFRYVCANKSQPIMLAAFAKHKSGPTDFTYGSTMSQPNALPGYIFDSEPDFFGKAYGATRM